MFIAVAVGSVGCGHHDGGNSCWTEYTSSWAIGSTDFDRGDQDADGAWSDAECAAYCESWLEFQSVTDCEVGPYSADTGPPPEGEVWTVTCTGQYYVESAC